MMQPLSLLKGKLVWMALILFFLPFSIRYCNYAIIAFLAYTVFTNIRGRRGFISFKDPSFWIASSFLIIAIFGLSYSSNLKAGFRAVEIQASLLVFPFIFSQLGILQVEFKRIKETFILLMLGLLVFLELRIILIMISSGYEFVSNFFSWDYTYENLTAEFVVQPVYIGTYIVIANIFCLSLFTEETKKMRRYLFTLIVLFNTFFLFQLSARSSIILNVVLISSYLIVIFYKEKRRFAGGIFIGAILMGTILLFNSNSFTRMRMLGFIKEMTSDNLKEYDPKSRLLIWPCAIEVINENKIIGVGTGDSEDELQEIYKKRNLEELYNEGLNAHNQYLTTVMRHGLIGWGILILNFVIPLYFYLKSKNIEAILFTFLIMGFFLTENVLSRAQGVIFYAFFHSIYLVITIGNNRYENTSLRN